MTGIAIDLGRECNQNTNGITGFNGRPDFKKAREKAAEVLAANAFFRLPVLPKQIAENYGYEVCFKKFDSDDARALGRLDIQNMRIYVNTDGTSLERQTFIIAHELGHALLHKHEIEQGNYEPFCRHPLNDPKIKPLEREADVFAAHMLMPPAEVNKYKDVASISELSQLFIVPEDVVSWRMHIERKQFLSMNNGRFSKLVRFFTPGRASL
jgi:Zn-dependent peptidase ImmA (M78 family)